MIGAIVVANYREYESWRRARFAVCSVLDVAQSLSGLPEHRSIAKDIDNVSVSILENLMKGFEGSGDGAFLRRAVELVDRLDRALRRAAERNVMTAATLHRLQRELKAMRRALIRQSRAI